MKKRIFLILYFVILFAILASYIMHTTQEKSVHLDIAMSNILAKDQQNLATVWVRNLDTDPKYQNCFLDTQWSGSETIPAKRSQGSIKVPESGEFVVPIPLLDDSTIGQIIPDLEDLFKREIMPLFMPDRDQVKSPMRIYAIDDEIHRIGLRFSLYCGEEATPVKSAFLSLDNLITPNLEKMDTIPLGERLGFFDESEIKGSPAPGNGSLNDSNDHPVPPKSAKVSEVKDSESESFIYTPSAFMFNEPNDVFVRIMDGDKLYSGRLQLEQTYGQKAKFPASVKMHGMVRIPISLQSPADFKFTAGSQTYYASLIPNERPFHASIADPTLTPDHHPVLRISPMGTMPTITVDYFLGPAWISRQTISPEQAANAELTPEYNFSGSPEIIYARVSTSTIAADSSQTFAIYAGKDPVDVALQAQQALHKLNPNSALDAALYTQVASSLPGTDTKACRDYAFARLAGRYQSSVKVLLKTEMMDTRDFNHQKDSHKTYANGLLVFWFCIGILAFSIAIGISIHKRREEWKMLKDADGVDAGEIPQTSLGPLILCLVILFIGMMISIYYMMQII